MKISPQDVSDWGRISPYLEQALELAPQERIAWLETLTGTQPEVARAVERMLSELAALDAKGFLVGPLPVTRLDEFMPVLERMMRERVAAEPGDWGRPLTTQERRAGLGEGMVLGAYRLLREIGYGGMSSVWLAQRSDGLLKRDVALKLPYEGPQRAQLAERFKRERDILATLTHPNIARLYDAGISASGQSYLAMEYVQGTMLTAHCDAARLPVNERLELFLQVLSAVGFAHTQLVLHRDLKPSNILVTDQGRVVLLDFGIAKLLAPEADPGLPLTEMVARMLTPDYASPEHIAGKALGTTSDVYSLGVVLYELLTGARPFALLQDRSRRALEEAVLTQDPPRPSQCVLTEAVALARHNTPRRLARTLTGDLDTVVLKALKKTPTQRYHSVGAFAQDISNYLQNLPVSARPDSTWYRARRFIARYKWQVAASTVAVLAIVMGGATSLWQAQVAESQARMAESQAQAATRERDKAVALASRNGAVSDFMSVLITDAALTDKPVTVRELLERSEQLATADLSESREDRAAILGNIALMTQNVLDDSGKASLLLERALALVEGSHDSDLRARLICDHAIVTTHTDPGRIDAANRAIQHEMENPQLDPAIASTCLYYLARISRATEDAPATLKYATQALDRFHHAYRQPLLDEATLLGGLASAYSWNAQNRQAERYYELALQKYVEAGRERSASTSSLLTSWAVVIARAGVPKRELELYDRALSLVKDSAAESSQATIAFNRAFALMDIGRYAQAREALNLALRLSHESKQVQSEMSCFLGLAALAEQSGDRRAAERYLSEANRLVAPSWRADNPALLRRLAFEGRLDLTDGRFEPARAKFDQILATKVKNPTTRIGATLGKAEVELSTGNIEGAVAQSQAALTLATSLQGDFPYSNNTGLALLMLARALHARGDVEQAREAYETAIANLSNTVDADHPELLRARRLLASSGGTH